MAKPKRQLLLQRKELVERYVRLTIYCNSKKYLYAIVRKIARFKLTWKERNRRRVLSSTLKTVAFEAARSRKNGFEATTYVMNLALFFLIAERDIQAVKIDALTHSDPWRRSLAARTMLLTIHELDLDKVAGNKIRQAFSDAKVPSELQNEVTEALRTIRKAQSKAQRQFYDLRNSTIAHRDPDAIRQYRNIINIDGVEIVNLAGEFYEGTRHFIDVLPRLVAYLGTWPALMGQLSAQTERKDRKIQSDAPN